MSEADVNKHNRGDESQEKIRSRKPLVVMLVVAVLPMFGAYFVFFTGIGMPKSTVNSGSFVQPALSLEGLVSEEEWQAFSSDKKWRILIPVAYPCSEECQQNLFTTRQVHIRLDQRSERVERYALFADGTPDDVKNEILADHPRLKVLAVSTHVKEAWFGQLKLDDDVKEDYYLLADQESRAMMAYDVGQHGNDVLKDLKRAIKFSIDYQ